MKENAQRILANPKFQELVQKRSAFAWTLSVAMLVIYFGFILLVAFGKGFLGTPIGSGVTTWGIPVGLFTIISAFILTGIYVRRANGEFDELNRQIMEEAK
jgi:Predicted membrane protein